MTGQHGDNDRAAWDNDRVARDNDEAERETQNVILVTKCQTAWLVNTFNSFLTCHGDDEEVGVSPDKRTLVQSSVHRTSCGYIG